MNPGRICWCGSAVVKPGARITLDAGESFRLMQCGGCGVGWLDPIPTDARLAQAYDADYYGQPRRKFVGPIAGGVAWFQAGRARSVARHLVKDARILDVGCGNGGFLARMKALGYVVTGTEWTEQSARRVDPSLGVPIHSGELLHLRLPGRSFDAITLWHVFEHLRDPLATLREIRRLLSDDGLLFLSLPNFESWQAKIFGGNWFHLDPPRHLYHFGPRSLGQLLGQTGFRVEHLSTFSMEQNPYGFMQSTLNALGLPRDQAYHVLKGGKSSMGVKVGSIAALAALAGPAFTESLAASAFGRGATMTLRARVFS